MSFPTKQDGYRAQQELSRSKGIFLLATAVFFVTTIGNLLLSHYEYVWNLLLNIVLTVVYGAYCVYYLTSLYPFLRAKCKFFADWESGYTRKEIVRIVDDHLEYVTREHLHYYAMTAKITVNTKQMDRQLLLVDAIPLPKGELMVTTLANVVLEYEVRHEE